MCLTQEGRSEAETLECARSYGVDLEYDSPPKRGMSYAEKVRRRDANEAADIERRPAANVTGVGVDREVRVEDRHSQVAQISQQFGGQVQATNTQGTTTRKHRGGATAHTRDTCPTTRSNNNMDTGPRRGPGDCSAEDPGMKDGIDTGRGHGGA